jgi:hypothetical protein
VGTARRECGKSFGVSGPAHGADNPMAGLQRTFRERSAQARAYTGDEEGLGSGHG